MKNTSEKVPPVTDDLDVEIIRKEVCAVCGEVLADPPPEECPYCGQKLMPFMLRK